MVWKATDNRDDLLGTVDIKRKFRVTSKVYIVFYNKNTLIV